MNIRDAIYRAGPGGRIKLFEKIFELPSVEAGGVCLLHDDDAHIFIMSELTSLDWEFLNSEWADE